MADLDIVETEHQSRRRETEKTQRRRVSELAVLNWEGGLFGAQSSYSQLQSVRKDKSWAHVSIASIAASNRDDLFRLSLNLRPVVVVDRRGNGRACLLHWFGCLLPRDNVLQGLGGAHTGD